MDITTLEGMAAHLHARPRPFSYAKDDYALRLLEFATAEGSTIDAVRRGCFGRLLHKPSVRAFLATCGGRTLHASDIRRYREGRGLPFRLSATRWPRTAAKTPAGWAWQQTTRPEFNLVLQLNFPRKHTHRLRRLVGHDLEAVEPGLHPARCDEEITLAWARLDVDVASGVALIEELQSDWVRDVLAQCEGDDWEARRWQRYRDEWLRSYGPLWDEAMLTAALVVLREQFVCHRVYCHTFEGGLRMKSMVHHWSKPPRSLYTKLPRRFCFEETDVAPHFLRRSPRPRIRRALARGDVRWFRLTL